LFCRSANDEVKPSDLNGDDVNCDADPDDDDADVDDLLPSICSASVGV
jgi:hypothetical protein